MSNDADTPTADAWHDLEAYIALPRLGGLTLSPDGTRLLVQVSGLDRDRTAFRSSWWSLDVTGQKPARRLTRSVEGEGFATFLRDGSLLFGSRRPTPPEADTSEAASSDDVAPLWLLPAEGGDAYPVIRRSGGYSDIIAARDADVVLARVPMHAGTDDDAADAAKREARSKKKVSAILHEGYPVRYWDTDLGPVDDRLVRLDLHTDQPDVRATATPLTGDIGRSLHEAGWSLSADGRRLVVGWSEPRPHGEVAGMIVSIDTATGERTVIASDDVDETFDPVVSADGTHVAWGRDTASTAEQAGDVRLWVCGPDNEPRPLAHDWDRWPSPVAFSPDNATLYCIADEDGHAPLFAVDVASGAVRRLTHEGAFGSVHLSPDGSTLYAVRTSYTDPGSVVAVDTISGEVRELRTPADYPALPGRLERVETTAADGARVPAWLVLPEGASEADPAPLALWIHGGPLGSWNAWSWRWCPWLLAAQGWAVLLPDPALSTGYGRDFIQRGWGRWGEAPYTDLMAITDAVEQRGDIDASRTVAMGGSFGGYMANWVAGHTDRFRGIVTHASLWNLETFGDTTDAAWYWGRELSPEMRTANSPHLSASRITTPMLVIHGDKDYRVPIGEGIALWWTLVSTWNGSQEDFPHKFLYFPDENHWVLSPQHAIIWYQTVLSFIGAAIGGEEFRRPELL